MTHIMVDLETLSTKCNAAIIAIGAVKFNHDRKVYDWFYQAVETSVSVYTSIEGKFHVSSDTLHWWSQQSEEARAVFTDPDKIPIFNALSKFTAWALEGTTVEDLRIWGNGASFDNAILSTAYDLCGMEQPWKFWNDRCYRTMKNIYPTAVVVSINRKGIFHNAVDDAESQATHLLAMEVPLR